MKTTYLCWPTLLLCLLLASCNKFLDIPPKGKILLSTVNDFDLWMGARNLGEVSGIPMICLMTDHTDVYPWKPETNNESTNRAYLWSDQFYDANLSPQTWSGAYTHIYYYNTVLNNVDAATGGSGQQKNQLKAEALLGRANEYFWLLNLYGKPFDAATAATDLAVPFVTASDIAAATPQRATVQWLYNQLISDIQVAIPNLPADNAGNRFRGSVHAAYSVLARLYFFMRNYSEAAKYAALALQRPGSAAVANYNVGVDPNGLFTRGSRLNEAIYARGSDLTSGLYSNIADSGFVKSYGSNDLRLRVFYRTNSGTFNYNTLRRGTTGVQFAYANGGNYVVQAGTTVGEMKLIMAENAARNNELPAALQQLNEIRINRFPTGTYTNLSSTNQEEVLSWVLRERRYEMPMNGIRWFDMRRLDFEGRMPAINRYDNANKIIGTLPPHSPRYTLQIPLNELVYNPDLPQNP